MSIRTAIAVLSLLAGALGSLYADEIKSSWPLCCWSFRLTGYRLSIQALTFWASAVTATLAFIIAQLASDTRRERSEARLNERAASLEELIRTMPPADFIELLVTTDFSARQTLQAVKNTPGTELVKADVKEAVRVILDGLAVLAQRFDASPLGAGYAANIMVFKPISDLKDDDPARVLPPTGRLRFTPKGSPLQGVLDLDLELSAMPRAGGEPGMRPGPDPLLKPLALPVPELDQTRAPNRRLRVLPGAPLAFILAQEQKPPLFRCSTCRLTPLR